MMRLPLLIFLLSLASARSFAQSIEQDVIQWTASNLTDVLAGEGVDTTYHCKFITYQNDKIEWIQGDYIIVMNVQKTQGNWADLTVDGSISYTVKIKDKIGKFIFNREAGMLGIRTEFFEESVNKLPFVFGVSEINKIQP
jgi:hypothetical protein